MTNRREFMSSAVSLAAMTAAVSVFGPSKVFGATNHKPLDPINPDHSFRHDELHLGPAARHRVGHQENRRARAAGHRALSEQHRAVSEESDVAQEAVRRRGRHVHRLLERRAGAVDEFHRPRADAEDDRGSRGVRARTFCSRSARRCGSATWGSVPPAARATISSSGSPTR